MQDSSLLFAENNWYLLRDEEKEMGGKRMEYLGGCHWAFVFSF